MIGVGGVSDLGAIILDAEADSPAAEVLIEDNFGAIREERGLMD
jgi:hypothetical protein